MPIHLPALTRRAVLKRGAAASASLLAGGHARADADKSETWLLFSDTHIAEDKAAVSRDVNVADHLQQAVREAVAMQEKQRAFGLLVNGDLALNEGTPGDYATFVELMRPLRTAGIDVHLTLGNHDDREAFWKGCEELTTNKKLIPLKHVGVITTALVNWVLLDSLDKTNSTPGVLGDSQLGWLERTLRDLPDKPTLVMVHHNPGPFEVVPGTKVSGLTDTAGLMRVIDAHSKVKAWIFGHTHTWEVKSKNSGLHLINLPPVAYPFDKKRPSGFVVARIDDKGMTLELRALNKAHEQHAEKKRLEWA